MKALHFIFFMILIAGCSASRKAVTDMSVTRRATIGAQALSVDSMSVISLVDALTVLDIDSPEITIISPSVDKTVSLKARAIKARKRVNMADTAIAATRVVSMTSSLDTTSTHVDSFAETMTSSNHLSPTILMLLIILLAGATYIVKHR